MILQRGFSNCHCYSQYWTKNTKTYLKNKITNYCKNFLTSYNFNIFLFFYFYNFSPGKAVLAGKGMARQVFCENKK